MIIPPKISRLPVVWELRKLTLYSIFSFIAIFRFRDISLIWNNIICLPVWWKYQQKKNEPLKNDHPWITFRAERFLRKILRKDMMVFEYGSGSSTMYFARRVAQVFSTEHHPGWYEHIRQILDEHSVNNVDYRLIEPDTPDGNQRTGYLSRHHLYKNKRFERYVKNIDAFPDGYFDLVMIDGRARTECIAHAKNKIKPGGYLVVDNSERTYYFNGNDFLSNRNEWKSSHFIGPTPYSFQFSKTSFFQKLHIVHMINLS